MQTLKDLIEAIPNYVPADWILINPNTGTVYSGSHTQLAIILHKEIDKELFDLSLLPSTNIGFDDYKKDN